LLEFVWPVTALLLFVALFVPWHLRIIDVPIAAIAALMAAVAALHALLPPLLAHLRRVRDIVLLFAHVAALAALAAVWCSLGGLAAPLFLMFFAAPVVAASTLFGAWGRQIAFVLTLVMVALASAIASPALRWYANLHGIDLGWLDGFESWGLGGGPFAHTRPEPMLECASLVFAVVALTALHSSASLIADVGRRLRAQLQRVVNSLNHEEGLLGDLVRSSPLLEALVLADSRRIVMASNRFRERFERADLVAEGADLRSLVEIQFPEALDALFAGADGSLDCQFRGTDGLLHAARVHVTHLAREGTRMVRFTLEPCEDSRQLGLAIEGLASAVIVIDEVGALVRANEAARSLFPEAIPGVPATRALNAPGLPQAWWQALPGSTVPRDFRVHGRRVRGRVVCRNADGQAGELIIVELGIEEPR
jgi:PAS domain-containing protein